MMRFVKTLVGLAVVAGATLAVNTAATAQVSKQGNGYLFRMKYTKGQTFKYNIESSTKAGGANMAFVMPVTMKVNSVTNGVADTTVTMGQMMMNGKPMNTGAPQPTNVKIDSRGKAQGAGAQMGINTTYPEKAVPIGGTWTGSVPMQGMGQLNASYKFTGISNAGARRLAKINVTFSGQATGGGTILVDMADGSAVSSTMKLTMTPPAGSPGGSAPIVVNVKVTRK